MEELKPKLDTEPRDMWPEASKSNPESQSNAQELPTEGLATNLQEVPLAPEIPLAQPVETLQPVIEEAPSVSNQILEEATEKQGKQEEVLLEMLNSNVTPGNLATEMESILNLPETK